MVLFFLFGVRRPIQPHGRFSARKISIRIAFWARGGLAQLVNGVVERVWTTEDGLLSNQIWDVAEDHDGVIWVATEEGLNRLEGQTLASPAGLDAIVGRSVARLLVDRNNALWIGTDGGGLGCLRDGVFTVFTTTDGLANDRVKSLCEDPTGGVWVGTHGGLCHFHEGSFSTYTTTDGLRTTMSERFTSTATARCGSGASGLGVVSAGISTPGSSLLLSTTASPTATSAASRRTARGTSGSAPTAV